MEEWAAAVGAAVVAAVVAAGWDWQAASPNQAPTSERPSP